MPGTNGTMPDKLIVRDLQRGLDGEYECDLTEMLSVGAPGSLTNREGHRIKVMSGVRMGQIMEALQEGDNDVLVALAAVVLARHGKRFDEDVLWDSPMGAALDWDIADRSEEDDADPPEPRKTRQRRSSGSTSESSSASPESGPSPTGLPSSDTSATSDPET